MSRENTAIMLDSIRDFGVPDKDILDYLLFNYFSSDDARRAMESAQWEFITNRNFIPKIGQEYDI